MSFQDDNRAFCIPKAARRKHDGEMRSADSWWCKPGENQLTDAHRKDFYKTVAKKQAELTASRFGTLASMIYGPDQPKPGKKRELEL